MDDRPRGHRRRRPDTGDPAVFEALVAHALDTIPEPFARGLDDVAVVIDDEPSPQQRREAGLRYGQDLYGLYEGVPRTAYGRDWAAVPNKITLFRLPLEEDFPDPDDLERQVRHTVIHELAHHLGISDARLHDLGAY